MGSSTKELRTGSVGAKLLSILMTLVLVVGLAPMPKQAYAADFTTASSGITVQAKSALNAVITDGTNTIDKEGTSIVFYEYDDYGYKYDKLSPSEQEEGKDVYFNLVSDAYDLASCEVKFGDETITATLSSGYYKFTMPAGAVTVTATVAEKEFFTLTGTTSPANVGTVEFGLYDTSSYKVGSLTQTGKAVADSKVAVKATPTDSSAYRLVDIVYTTTTGETSPVTPGDTYFNYYNNTWYGYFTMPNSDVTVEAQFVGADETVYKLSWQMASPTKGGKLEKKAGGESAYAQISSLTATSDPAFDTTSSTAPGEISFSIIGKLGNGSEVNLTDTPAKATWGELYQGAGYKFSAPGQIDYKYPTDKGVWTAFERATWVVDGQTVKTVDSASWTIQVTNDEEGEYSLTLDNSDSHGSISASIAHSSATNTMLFSEGDTITVTASNLASGYVLEDVVLKDGNNSLFYDAGFTKTISGNVATILIEEGWKENQGNSDLTVVPVYRNTNATKYTISADSSVVGGSIYFLEGEEGSRTYSATSTTAAVGDDITFLAVPSFGYACAAEHAAGKIWKSSDEDKGALTGVAYSGAGVDSKGNAGRIFSYRVTEESNLTASAVFTERKIDLDSDVSKVKPFNGEKYGETGEELTLRTPEITFKGTLPSGWANPVRDVDYTLSVEKEGDSSVTELKTQGTYTVTMAATPTSAHYTGQRTGTVTVTPYFTVYKQEGSSATAKEVKVYSKSEFDGLQSPSTEPVSALFFKGGVWRVSTAKTYVTLDDLLTNAGIASDWKDGATLKYEKSTFSYDDITNKYNRFYPGAAGAVSDDVDNYKAAPFVFALQEYSDATSSIKNAAAIQTSNLENANGTNAPRTICGISADQYTAAEDDRVGGSRLWDGLTSITIVTDGSSSPDPAVEKIDLGGSRVSSVKKFDGEGYGYTGEAITPRTPEFNFSPALPAGWSAPKLNEDYTLSVVKKDNPSVTELKEKGEYTITATATAASEHYTGSRMGTITVADTYFTVKLQEGASGTPAVVSTFSKDAFNNLKSVSTEPVSGLYYKGGVWKVKTAATYVTLEDLLVSAGIDDKWVSGSSIKYAAGDFASSATFEDLAAKNKFYPEAVGDESEGANNYKAAPFVFALTGGEGTTSNESPKLTAADVEKANVASPSDKNAPVAIYGVSEAQYAGKNAAGSRLVNGCMELTVITEGDAPIAKKDNPISVKTKQVSKTYSAAAQTIKAADAFTVENAQGAVTYAKTSGDSGITVASDGTITLAKGLAAKDYTVGVKVTAAGNDDYNAGSKDVTVAIKVAKAANGLTSVTAKNATQTVKYSAKAQSIALSAFGLTAAGASGAVSYKIKSTTGAGIAISGANLAVPAKLAGGKTYTVVLTATAAGDGNHNAASKEVTVNVKVDKLSQTISAKNVNVTYKGKKLVKSKKLAKKQTIDVKKKGKVSAKTTVKYAKVGKVGGAKIKVNAKTGKITVAKGLKSGTYKVKVKLTAAANSGYAAAKAKTITVKVVVAKK